MTRSATAFLSQAFLFFRDRRAVAAVEFAFIAPILLAMYFLTMEVAQAVDTNKKVSRVGSMVADLITQQQNTDKSQLEAIMKIGSAILAPYSRSEPKIVVTAIEVTDETTPKIKVVWSRKLVAGAFSQDTAPGTTTTVPPKLNVKGSFLIRVESYLTYKPVLTWTASGKQTTGLTAAFNSLNMKETYYLRPRMSTTIPCSNC